MLQADLGHESLVVASDSPQIIENKRLVHDMILPVPFIPSVKYHASARLAKALS